MAKPLSVISTIWKWPQEPMLNDVVPHFWGPMKLTSSLLADSDTGTQCGRWNTLRNNTSACEIDTQLYTDCFCKECLFWAFFLTHLQKISVNCEWISSMAQRGGDRFLYDWFSWVWSYHSLSASASFSRKEDAYLAHKLQLDHTNRSGSAKEKIGAKHLKLKLCSRKGGEVCFFNKIK